MNCLKSADEYTEVTLNQVKGKVSFKYESMCTYVKIKVMILRVNEQKLCIDFTYMGGDKHLFYDRYKLLTQC
jgi:hypothetical protein